MQPSASEVGDLGPVDGDQVGVVRLDVRVHLAIDAPRPEEEVHHVAARGSSPSARHRVTVPLQEPELVGGDPARPAEPSRAYGDGGAPRSPARPGSRAPPRVTRTLDRVDQPGRPAPPPKLAVGHRREPERFLEANHLLGCIRPGGPGSARPPSSRREPRERPQADARAGGSFRCARRGTPGGTVTGPRGDRTAGSPALPAARARRARFRIFPDGTLRQLVDDLVRPRHLVGREVRPAVRVELCGRRRRAGSRHHEGPGRPRP